MLKRTRWATPMIFAALCLVGGASQAEDVFLEKERDNVHDDFVVGAPASLKNIPTEYAPQYESDVRASLLLELGHQYRMGANKSVGVGSMEAGYQAYMSMPEFGDYAYSYALGGMGKAGLNDIKAEYYSRLEAFNSANAFERRRLIKPFVAFMEGLPKGDPFTDLAGKSFLQEINYEGSVAFDFDDMSKTLVMQDSFCDTHENANGFEARTDKVRVYPQVFAEQQGDNCLLTIRFEDDVLAERFEGMVNEGTLGLFLKNTYTPYATYGFRSALGEQLVFVEKRVNNTYKVNSVNPVNREPTVYIYHEDEYAYVMSMSPKKVVHDASNLFASAYPTEQSAHDHTNKERRAERDLKNLTLLAPLDYAFEGGARNNPIYTTLSEDGVMTITTGDETQGAYAEYQWVQENGKYYAYMTKRYFNQVVLPDVYELSSTGTTKSPRSGKITDVSVDLKARSSDLRGFRFNLTPVEMASVLALQEKMGVSEATLKPVRLNLSYANKASFRSANKAPSVPTKAETSSTAAQVAAEVGKPTASVSSPPYNLVCDLEVTEQQEGGTFMKYAKTFKGRQLIPAVDITEFLDSVVSYSKKSLGDNYRPGGRQATAVEIKQFVGKKQGTISSVYMVEGNYLKIDSIFPTAVVPAGDAVKDALCTMIEAL